MTISHMPAPTPDVDYFQSVALPQVGDVYHWEPLKPHASQEVVVTNVQEFGGEWWIQSELPGGGGRYWNDLSRWLQATVLIRPMDDPL